MIEKNKSNLFISIEDKIKNIINDNAFNIVDIEIIGGKNSQVIILLYKDGSFGIEELGKINRAIYPLLETIPALKNGFTLEISSPGIYRNIKFQNEFNIFKGRELKIITIDNKEVLGTCKGIVDSSLSLTINNEENRFLLSDIKSAKLNG